MKNVITKKIPTMLFLLILLLCISYNISCKKSNQTQPENEKKSNVDLNAKSDKNETWNRLNITDSPNTLSESQTDFQFSSLDGNDEETLKKNCYSFYSEYWKNEIKGKDEIAKEDPSYKGLMQIKEIIKKPEIDITVKLFQNNIAIINRTEMGIDGYLGLEKMDDIWIYHSNKWKILNGCTEISYRKVLLLNLNNDEYIDAIVKGGCCDTDQLNIFIGVKDKILFLRQHISFQGIGGLKYNNIRDSQIKAEPFPDEGIDIQTNTMSAFFDCSVNGFVLIKNQ